jgi:hypothetical protein
MSSFAQSLTDLIKNPVTRYCTLGTSFRKLGIFACDYYLPAFFMLSYPGYKAQFGVLFACCIVIGGLISSISGGILSDKYGRDDPKAYSKIACIGGLLAWPAFVTSVLVTNNFWVSIGCTFLKYILGENFWSPAATMIKKSVPPAKIGNYISGYQFFMFMSGCISTFTFGTIVNYLGCATNPVMLGRILAGFCSVAYGGSIISYWLAGKHFVAR